MKRNAVLGDKVLLERQRLIAVRPPEPEVCDCCYFWRADDDDIKQCTCPVDFPMCQKNDVIWDLDLS